MEPDKSYSTMSQPEKKKQRLRAAPTVDKSKRFIDEMVEYVSCIMSKATKHGQEEAQWFKEDYLWDDLPRFLKIDRRVAYAAMVHRCCKFSTLPIKFRTDEEFLLECIEKESECWLSLPEQLKNDIRFAMAVIQNGEEPLAIDEEPITIRNEIFEDLLQRFPSNREFWKKLISNNYANEAALRAYADITIRSDRNLTLDACTRCRGNLEHVHESLQVDKSFLDALLQKTPAALSYLSREAQRQFPELVRDHLQAYFHDPKIGGGSSLKLFGCIAPELWNDRQMVVSWFQGGGYFVHTMPALWRDDREIFLLMAKHSVYNGVHILRRASATLLADKDFAMAVLEERPNAFFSFDHTITGDLDVAILGRTGFPDFREACEGREGVPRNLATDTTEKVTSLLAAHKSMQALLLGISDTSSALSMLDLGHETSLGFKKLIADFLDVPVGRKLRHVRKAALATETFLIDLALSAHVGTTRPKLWVVSNWAMNTEF